MARVQRIKKARVSKKRRSCRICGSEVQLGESYKKIEKKTGPRSSQTLIFCHQHEPRPSHSSSGRSSELAEMQEDYEDGMKIAGDDLTDQAEALSAFASGIEELSGSIRESAESIESGFGHSTAQSEAMASTAEELETWAQEMESHATSVPESDDASEIQDWISEVESLIGNEPPLDLQG